MFELMPFERRRDNALMNRFFEDFDRSFFRGAELGFRTDIRDNGDSYVIEAELPGFDKKDVHIDVAKDVLTVSAQHSEEKKEDKDNYVHRERSWGSFSRSFDLTGVDADGIKAAYKNGILELTLPKQTAQPESSRTIAVE